VSRGVVRRRKVEDEPPAAHTTTVVRRRRVVDASSDAGHDERASAPRADEPVAAPPVVREPERVEPPAPVVVPSPVAAAPVRTPEPVVAAPAPVVAVPVEAPVRPAPVAKPEPAPVAAAPPKAAAPAPTPTPAPEPPASEPAERNVRAAGRYAGLGSAVVVPPPGYDPTNPDAYRATVVRQQAERRAAAAPQQAAPPTELGTTAWRSGRRRVDAAAPAPVQAPAPSYPTDNSGNDGRPVRRQRRAGMEGQAFRRKTRRKAVGPKKVSPAPKAQKRKIFIDNHISVAQLAKEMSLKATAIIRHLMEGGQMVRVNDMLDFETATLIAAEFDYECENVGFVEDNFLQHVEVEDDSVMQPRPPVVTIMGHVDHGKTTLLDAIRNTRVAHGEAGGITQHVGAYQVLCNGTPITFIDTPGHAAFSAMRARGAKVTDIVILVVAADDGVQPQTEEAIAHSKAAGVPIIVAVNKMDKPDVNPDTVKARLVEFGLNPEEWGGETLYAPVSALKGDGIDGLLEQILLQAEVLDLRANPDRHADGIVIEAKMERGRGAVASLLIQNGTLERGDFVVMGAAYGRVRAMHDDLGKQLKTAGPSTPVEIFGLSDLPEVGDTFSVVKSEKDAKRLAEHRSQSRRDAELSLTQRRTADDIFAAAGPQNEILHVVIKADVQGSLEALKSSLLGINVDGTAVRVLHAGVGDISESDVNLVGSNGGLLIGFNVKIDAKARRCASDLGVEPAMFSVIYGAIDHVTALLSGMLEPEYEHVRQGSAEVRATFSISKIGTVAGLMVLDGKIARSHHAKVVRDGNIVWEGKVSTLKRFKDDVREVGTGYECGLVLDGFNDITAGDIVESYSLELVQA